MISDRTLEIAIMQGDITADQARRLREIEAAWNESPQVTPDDEKLRFITGFADIFVTIGIGLFLSASSYFLHFYGAAAANAGIAALAWILAEFFTRRRRLALPSIVLLVVFAVTIFRTFLIGAGHLTGVPAPDDPFFSLETPGLALGMAAIATALFTVLHYWRFKVPITIAASAAALCILPLSLTLFFMKGESLKYLPPVIFICGLAVFALAMRFDMSDPKRETRRTDIAFWLHLLAAPLLVHSLIQGLLGVHFGEPDTLQSIIILAIFLALGVIAIIIDRRAILVSGLIYAGIAFGKLLSQSAFATLVIPATVLTLGICVLLLSAFWQPLRRIVLKLIPPRIASHLPHALPARS